jgi:hypothetical protein
MARLSPNKKACRLLRFNAKRLWKAVDKRFLLMPPLFTVGMSALIYTNIYFLPKQTLELMAVSALSLFTICLAVRFWVSRHPFFLWSTGLCGILLMREVHFETTSDLVYVALLVLLYFTLKQLDELQSYLLHTRIATWLATGFVVYFISITVDQRWWRGLPWEDVVHVPLEETLEMIGHLIIGLALLLAKPGSAGKIR